MGHTLLEYAKQENGGDKQDDVAEKLFKVINWFQISYLTNS